MAGVEQVEGPFLAGRRSVRPTPRNLFVTLKMLRAEGLQVSGRLGNGRLYLFIVRPDPGTRPLAAVFDGEDLAAAAEWLAAAVLRHHPRSAFAQLWRAIRQAVLALPR